MPHADPEARRAYHRAYYAKNRAQVIATVKRTGPAWARANRDKKNAAYKRWRDKNPEKARANVARWKVNNPELVIAREAERSAWRRGAARERSSRPYALVLLGDPCAYCGGPSDERDHIDPVSLGGQHHWENLTAACRSCNRRKFTKRLLPFLIQEGGGAHA